MKTKTIFKVSVIFSLLFLFILTLLTTFIFIISLKPVKLNLLNYFDRESEIFKRNQLDEIGDVFLSFNKITKNFELLIEDLVVDKSYFPSILISLDITFSKNIFESSIKIFDADIEVNISEDLRKLTGENSPTISNLKSRLNFLENFTNIQLINNKIKFLMDEGYAKEYSIDLNFKNREFLISLSEMNMHSNYLSLNFSKINDQYDINLELEKFNFDFFQLFFDFPNISFHNLFLTGSSEILIESDNSVEELFFNLSLDGKLTYDTFQGIEKINLDRSEVFGKKKDDNVEIVFNLSHLKSLFKFILRINLKENTFSEVLVKVNEIELSNLIRIWPKDYQDSVYYWMKPNTKGKISDFVISSEIFYQNEKLDFRNLKGKFNFYETEIKYMDSMPSIKRIKGDAEIYADGILFNISEGSSEKLKILGGEVELYNLDTDVEKARVSLKISSKNVDVIDYLNHSIINKNSYGKLKQINGDTFVNLQLDFPLLLTLSTEQINYSSKVFIENSVFTDLSADYSLENFELKIKIDNERIVYNGQGYFHKSEVKFDGVQLSEENKIIDKITGSMQMNSYSIEALLPENEMQFDGIISIDFSIYEDDDKTLKIEGVGDLNNFSLNSNFLGPNLDFDNGKVRFLIRPYDKNYSGFFDLKAKNLLIEINSLFVKEKIMEMDVVKFKSPLQDFRLNYKNDENKFKISGNKLTLEKIDISQNKKFESENINFDLKIDDLVIRTRSYNDARINFIKSNGFFSNFNFDLKGDNDFHNIRINDEVYQKKFVLESNYIPGLLEIFDLDLNINKGSLKVEGVKGKDSSEYIGAIAGKNLVFYDAPFFANFFSIFSLEGFAQKIKDGGIIFSTFNSDYKFSEQRLKIIDALLKGSELGISFDSVIGLDDDYFMMNGSIIPAYTINTLITKFPIVGDIITAGSPEDGLIGAKFRVEKIDGEYEVFYNPISVFVPNIIKNFLGD